MPTNICDNINYVITTYIVLHIDQMLNDTVAISNMYAY